MKVLFVCLGNICRSPMAEALFRQAAGRRPLLKDVVVASAGVRAFDGNTAMADAVAVMHQRFGLPLDDHRARRLTPLEDADLILAMDPQTTTWARTLRLPGRVEMLGDYAETGEVVEDPYGAGADIFDDCARLLQHLIERAADRLVRELKTPG